MISGIIIIAIGVSVIFVGSYNSKKIGILHVVIYFMGAFVILGGIIILLLYDKSPIF